MNNTFCDCKVRAISFTYSVKASYFMKIMKKVYAHRAFEFLGPDCKIFFLGEKKKKYVQILLFVFWTTACQSPDAVPLF